MKDRLGLEKIHPNTAEYLDFVSSEEESSTSDRFLGEKLLRVSDGSPLQAKIFGGMVFKDIRKRLQRYASNDQLEKTPLMHLLTEGSMAANDESSEIFKQARWLLVSNPQELDFTDENRFTDKMLELMIRRHGLNYERKAEKFEEKFEQLKESFINFFREYSRDNAIEIPTYAFDRLGRTQGILLDRILAEMEGIYGHADRSAIRVSTELIVDSKNRELEKVLSHEFIHILAGLTVMADTDQFGDDGGLDNRIREQRTGLTFTDSKYSGGGELKFDIFRYNWLSEAITEDLSSRIHPRASRTYLDERKLYKLLRESGKYQIPRALFQNAYFEDYDPSLPQGERVPHWKNLWHAINEAYGRGFLNQVDDVVSENGVQAGIDYVRAYKRKNK